MNALNCKNKPFIEEEKQKYRDYHKNYQREYRKNMTDEQKQKMKDYQKDYQKEYRKNMTDEQKRKYKNDKITDEQKEK